MNVLKAISTEAQADLIKRLINEYGYDVVRKNAITSKDIRDPNTAAILWFKLCTIPFIADAVFPFIYAKNTAKKPALAYVTVEGIPSRAIYINSNIPKIDFIANSKFTAECLKAAKLKVLGIVHHGLDVDLCNQAINKSLALRKQLENQHPDKCKLVYVGRNDPRKQLKLLSAAVDILNEKHKKDFVVILHTDPSAKSLFKQDNVILRSTTGSLSYLDVLTLMAACDYLVFPSVCEGFGLPVLEANGVGIPAIHAWFPPLSEFSSKEFNFVFDYFEEKYIPQKSAQHWIFHLYPPEALADMMQEAIKTWKRKPKKYQEYCEMAKKHSEKFDYHIVYKPLLSALRLTPINVKLEEAKVK